MTRKGDRRAASRWPTAQTRCATNPSPARGGNPRRSCARCSSRRRNTGTGSPPPATTCRSVRRATWGWRCWSRRCAGRRSCIIIRIGRTTSSRCFACRRSSGSGWCCTTSARRGKWRTRSPPPGRRARRFWWTVRGESWRRGIWSSRREAFWRRRGSSSRFTPMTGSRTRDFFCGCRRWRCGRDFRARRRCAR